MKTTIDFHRLTQEEAAKLREGFSNFYARVELRLEVGWDLLFASDPLGSTEDTVIYVRDLEWDAEEPDADVDDLERFDLVTTNPRELEEYLAGIGRDCLLDEMKQVREGKEERDKTVYIAALKEELFLAYCQENHIRPV